VPPPRAALRPAAVSCAPWSGSGWKSRVKLELGFNGQIRGMASTPSRPRGYGGLRTPSRRAVTPNSARGRTEQDGVVKLPLFDLAEHPSSISSALFPSRSVKTTLVLKPPSLSSRLKEEVPCVVYAPGTPPQPHLFPSRGTALHDANTRGGYRQTAGDRGGASGGHCGRAGLRRARVRPQGL
jgi:hypothetical protein